MYSTYSMKVHNVSYEIELLIDIYYDGNHLIRVCIFNYYLLDTNTKTEFFSVTSTPNELSLVTEMRLASDLGPYLEANEVEETKLLWKAIRVAGKVFLSYMMILKLLLIKIYRFNA